ncbi:SET domain-containing protein [Maricaulis sp. CAU 1757]
MLLVDTYLLPSPIEGLGVYASDFIARGTRVWVLDPQADIILPADAVAERPTVYQDYIRRYAYFDATLDAYLLDGDHARFLNHSDDPNLDFSAPDGSGTAKRDIQAGEEILCDYSQFMSDVVLLPARRVQASSSIAA